MLQRKSKFSEKGLTVLIDAVTVRQQILFSPGGFPAQTQARLRAWQEVLMLVNGVERTQRTWEECRKKIHDLKKSARNKVPCNNTTSGGPSTQKELSLHEERVLEIFGPEPTMRVEEGNIGLDFEQRDLQFISPQHGVISGGDDVLEEGNSPSSISDPSEISQPASSFAHSSSAIGALGNVGDMVVAQHSSDGQELDVQKERACVFTSAYRDESTQSASQLISVKCEEGDEGEEIQVKIISDDEDLEGGDSQMYTGPPMRQPQMSRVHLRSLSGRAVDERGIGPLFRRQMLRQGDDTIQLLTDMSSTIRSGLAPVQQCAAQLPDTIRQLRQDLVQAIRLLRREMRCVCRNVEQRMNSETHAGHQSAGVDTQLVVEAIHGATALAAATMNTGISQAISSAFATLNEQLDRSMAAGFLQIAETQQSILKQIAEQRYQVAVRSLGSSGPPNEESFNTNTPVNHPSTLALTTTECQQSQRGLLLDIQPPGLELTDSVIASGSFDSELSNTTQPLYSTSASFSTSRVGSHRGKRKHPATLRPLSTRMTKGKRARKGQM